MMNREDGTEMGSPISDIAYDVITALHSKLEGLEIYETFAEDGNPDLWRQLSELDQQAVRLLVDELEQMVRDGNLREAA
jgi:hypothetical protein